MSEPIAASAAPRASAPPPASRPRVLCVDDEPNVLDGLTLHLRRVYDVVTAAGGAAALDLIRAQGAPAVVVSDMRMPGMDGNALLGVVRRIAPDTVRLLLTGRADLDSAIAAINDGQVFRFLTKPCAPPELLAAVGAAADQHRLITAERVLLEQTLHGSIAALVDVLSLTSPVSFGRATRIRQLAGDLADRLGMPDRWQIEVAAMLSQLGCVTLPRDVAEKVYHGLFLTPDEQAMVAGLPAVTERLLAHIPRLEDVRAILAQHQRPLRRRTVSGPGSQEPSGVLGAAGALRAATDFDALEVRGSAPAAAIGVMRGRDGCYDDAVLDALAALRGGDEPAEEVRAVGVGDLRAGMVLAGDVRTVPGILLATRGFVVTESFIARCRNTRRDELPGPLQIIVPTAAPSQTRRGDPSA